MNCAAFLILTAPLAWPQDTDEAKRALAIIKKANGRVELDDKLPGKPVVYLNL